MKKENINRSFFLLLTCLILFFFSGILFGQSNDLLDELLTEEEASFGKVVYLVMIASGRITEDISIENAIISLQDAAWKRVKIKDSEESIKVGELSHILMSALEIKGGLMYRMIPCPRYAFRDLTYEGLIKGLSDPSKTLSGEEAITLIARVVEWDRK